MDVRVFAGFGVTAQRTRWRGLAGVVPRRQALQRATWGASLAQVDGMKSKRSEYGSVKRTPRPAADRIEADRIE